MSRTVLVTGACGFTGSNMLEYLDEEWPSADVVATDLPGSGRGEYYVEAPDSSDPQPVYYEDILDELDIEFIPGDLTNSEDVEEIVSTADFDVVFHIASLFDYFAPREALYRVNTDGTRNLLSALAAQGSPRVIHWSTLGVLGDAGFDQPKDETSSYHPHNRYCESKVAQEQIVKAYGDRLDVTIVRPAPIYGPRHRYGIYNVLSGMEDLGFAAYPRLYPRKKQLQFPSVHVDDIVGAAVYLAQREEAVGETYNVVSDSIGQDEMLSFLADELGIPDVAVPAPYFAYVGFARALYAIGVRYEKRARENDTRPWVDAPTLRYLTANTWFSNEKLKATGYEMKYLDARDGLREYIAWCREHGYLNYPEERSSRVASIKRSLSSRLPTS